jgi:hypothetical protein
MPTFDILLWLFLGKVPKTQFSLGISSHPFLEELQIPDVDLQVLAVLGGRDGLFEGVVIADIPEA